MALIVENENEFQSERFRRVNRQSISFEPIVHRAAVVSAFLFVIVAIAIF